jgi:hypothetical protein
MFRSFGFIAPKHLNYFTFHSFDFERTWWRLFQKRVVRTKFYIYGFIPFKVNNIYGYIFIYFKFSKLFFLYKLCIMSYMGFPVCVTSSINISTWS